MKKIFYSICLVALAASCTKNDVSYNVAEQISLAPLAQTSTRAALAQGAVPTENLIVSANAGMPGSAASACSELYFDKVEFVNNNSGIFTASGYFWPNVKHLSFAGVTKSAGVNISDVEIDVDANSIIITDYPQQQFGTAQNDLMWFEHTSPVGKTDNAIDVTLKHACSWIVLNFKGTGDTGATRPWKITKVTIDNLSVKETATLAYTPESPTEAVAVWTENNQDANLAPLTVYEYTKTEAEVAANAKYVGQSLSSSTTFTPDATGIIVIPQTPTRISVTYNYISQVRDDAEGGNIVIEETATADLDYDGTNKWAAGKKYTYDVTIGAKSIKIAPTASTWVDYDSDGNSANGNQPIPGRI
jgi:hypothetical protein